jgi:hypothetical protein
VLDCWRTVSARMPEVIRCPAGSGKRKAVVGQKMLFRLRKPFHADARGPASFISCTTALAARSKSLKQCRATALLADVVGCSAPFRLVKVHGQAVL